MTVQRHLFDDYTATVRTRQPELFFGVQSEIRCVKCGRFLVETESAYVNCPKGCGKLIPDFERCGSWFDEDDGLFPED